MASSWEVENLKGAITLAVEGMRSLILVNGGAAIGILTFYGNVLSKNPQAILLNQWALQVSLASFGFGVLAALLCSLCAYIAQRIAATGGPALAHKEMPFTYSGVALALASAIFFFVGLITAGLTFN